MDPQRPRLLVVDDDRAVLTLIGTLALEAGFEVATTGDAADALAQLRRRPADLVLLDLATPGVNGLDVLHAVREVNTGASVVLMTAAGSIEQAVEAVQRGASDYVTKPFDTARVQRLLAEVRDAAEQRRALQALECDLAQRLEFCGMIGRAPAMREIFGLIRRLAPHAHTVLITGESGTGKELVARALHKLGPRSGARFTAVPCSAGAGQLVDATLATAAGSTLFLDNVRELPLDVQARLLRASADGDVALIATTNRDLRDDVAAGRFDAALFHHLRSVEVAMPPLRDRREDIPYLTAAFVRAFSQRFGKPLVGLTPGAERLLRDAAWDGNVRQLRNVLERACILADAEYITETDLAGVVRESRIAADAPAAWAAVGAARIPAPLVTVEREHIVRTLHQVRGNKAVAARLLGISRRAFYRQLERHGLHQRVPAPSRYDVEQL
jgi:DNA-binding NtrC family response regulator